MHMIIMGYGCGLRFICEGDIISYLRIFKLLSGIVYIYMRICIHELVLFVVLHHSSSIPAFLFVFGYSHGDR
jgi:hypothetical protein